MAANVLRNFQGYGVNLALGTLGGILVGNAAMKITKKTGIAAGAGILLYEIALYNGFVKTNWDDIMQKIKGQSNSLCSRFCSPAIGNQFKSLVKKNKALSVGFVGGSLLGIATA